MKKRIICFGDSNTWGHNPQDGSHFDEETRWPQLLGRFLGDSYDVVEEGQNGRTTVWNDPVENRLAGLTYLWPCMDTHHPFEAIIVMLGTNDTKNYFGVPAKCIADSAGRLVDMAQKSSFGPNGTHPKVLLISPVRISENNIYPHIFDSASVEKAKGFSAAFRATAAAYGCDFLDAAEYTSPSAADGIHFDAESHKKFAEAVAVKIRAMLEPV